MFKVNNKDTRTMPRHSGMFVVNFEHVIAGWEIHCSTPYLKEADVVSSV